MTLPGLLVTVLTTAIAAPAGQTMMMDAGSHLPNNCDRVPAALKQAGVKNIDYMVATHHHNHHFGAIADLAPLIPIAHFVDHGAFIQYHKDRDWYLKWFALFPFDAASIPRQVFTSAPMWMAATVTNERNQYSKIYEAGK
jgi:beta-lactamase superfamily II metal-dependent hydrolase